MAEQINPQPQEGNAMADRYILTVYIAEGGTPLLDRRTKEPKNKESLAGHMWYSIQKQGDPKEQSYGFSPKKEGSPSGPGKVSPWDNDTYYKPRYAQVMEITEKQYLDLKKFGDNGLREKWTLGFDGKYKVVGNSCVNFTWAALEYAGLASPDERKWIPSHSWPAVKALTNPAIPNSYFNQSYYGPTSKEAKSELTPGVPVQEISRPVEVLQKRQQFRSPTSPTPAPPPTNMHRLIQAHISSEDTLWAVSITGREALSSLYRFTVRFKSDSPDVDCQAMIGDLCALELETDQQGKRWLSGQMIDFAAVGHEGRHWVYEATVAPKLWHASRRADFRIWQNQTVPDIIYEVLGENAVRFDMRLKANYKTWTYLVQYRETDLNFILRQLEHEGIFFWFEHAEDGETLVLADHFTAHPECPGYATVPYYSGVQTRPDQDHFDGWRLTRRVETGRLIHSDYDFERPSSDLTTEHADPRGHLFDQYERFHYPGDYIETSDGNQYAANTLERLQRGQEIVRSFHE